MNPDDEPESELETQREDFARYFQDNWRRILKGLFLFVCAFALIRGGVKTFLDDQVPTAAKHRVESGREITDLRIIGWVERDRATAGIPLHIHFNFVNPSPKPIVLTFLDIEAPGFQAPTRFWPRMVGFPLYLDGSTKPVSSRNASLTIPAGGRAEARVELVPFQSTGSSMLTSLFQWPNTQGVQQHLAFELGPIRLSSRWLQLVSNTLDTGTSLVQTFALPLVITLLGLMLQQLHQDSIQQRQTWAALLPKYDEKISKLYLPFIAGVQTFEFWIGKWKEGKAGKKAVEPGMTQEPWTCDEAFFFLLFSLRVVREIDKNGWFSLMEKDWEGVLSDMWGQFAARVREVIQPYERLSDALDLMTADETISIFQGRLRKKLAAGDLAKIKAVENQFLKWRDKQQGDFALLSLIRAILEFEMNQIYKFWYSTPLPFPKMECEKLLAEMREEDLQSVKTKIEDYVKKRTHSFTKPRRQPWWEVQS